jgi:hypothetical protein
MAERLFSASRLTNVSNDYSHWYGRRVFIGDGTYLQLQDTPSIREEFAVKYKGKETPGYPQALLEVITERGSGQIYSFSTGNRHLSELELFHAMADQLPANSLLLLDDLYNSYEILAKCISRGIDVLVPSKRFRVYELIEEIDPTDQIIRIKPSQKPKWLSKADMPGELTLRRLVCKSPVGKEYVLFSTILDKTISREEFQMQYLTRWDIEIGIREIKTLMDINILRSKTPEMALKELTVALATYNLIRKVIYASIKDLPFSPKDDFIQKFYTINKDVLVDKKGRVYSKWSTGRKRTDAANSK